MENFKVLCSSGAFIGRKNGRNHKLFLDVCDTVCADGFEFMMYDSWYEKTDEVIGDFKAKGLYTPTLHADKMIGEHLGRKNANLALQNFKKNCEIANKIGAQKIVLHLWNGPSSDDNIDYNISALGELYAIAGEHTVTLTVENVVCRNSDPLEHLYAIANKYDAAKFTLDTKMSAFHGTLENVYSSDFKWLWDRVEHLHVNDYFGKVKEWESLATLHIGQGNIDFDRFFRFIKSLALKITLTLECTSMGEGCELYPEKMNESIKKVRKFLAQGE